MAVNSNTVTQASVVEALDQEFVERFRGEFDRFAEIIGMFPVETMSAGTTLYQYKITGTLLDGTATEGTSGTGYTDGDFIARSKYELAREAIDEVAFIPYAKQTTANAIAKAGFENAISRTDRKARQQMRAAIMSDFFKGLANGTSEAYPETGTWNLQQVLAYVGAKLGDALETNGEEGGDVVHFVNRQDAAAYLATATITTQDTFGMTYLNSFLGAQNVLLTNKVPEGTVYATPVDNIHAYALDFSALGAAGLAYETDDLGLVGVHHEPDYNYGSAETFLVRGAKFVPEILDFIAVGYAAKPAETKG